MANSISFNSLWQSEDIRAEIISYLENKELRALRLVASSIQQHTTKPLFIRTQLTFTPSSLTRPARLESLARIGSHIEHLTFCMSHNEKTFLPPLIHPLTGEELNFLYTPHTSVESMISRPKYGTTELASILTAQYPPIFHAATNVPSFIRFLRCLPNLRHLTILTPNQDTRHRYRRSSVDYALTSLRIALERATLPALRKLTLETHASALLYLRSTPGIGSSPRSPRIWSQIHKLALNIDAWDFCGPNPGRDQLRIVADYLRAFTPQLEKLWFSWNGRRGPCPLTLATDPLLAPPRTTRKLFAEVTSPMSPLPAVPERAPIVFSRLRFLQVRNTCMAASQVAQLVGAHNSSVREFDFEDVALNVGEWEEALRPLEDSEQQWRSEYYETSYTDFETAKKGKEGDVEKLIDKVIDSFSPPSWPTTPTTTVNVKRKRSHRRRRRPKHKSTSDSTSTSTHTSKSRSENRDIKPPQTPPALPVLQPDAQASCTLLPQTVYSPTAQAETGLQDIQGVQRNPAHDALQYMLVDDAVRRTSALMKAKEALLLKLEKEFAAGEGVKGKGKGKGGGKFGGGKMGSADLRKSHGSEMVPILFSRY